MPATDSKLLILRPKIMSVVHSVLLLEKKYYLEELCTGICGWMAMAMTVSIDLFMFSKDYKTMT